MLAAAVVAATAFAPQPTLLPQTVVTPRLSAEPVMTAASSRRAALLTGAALTVSALPAFADSIEEIAARNAAAAEAARVAKLNEVPVDEDAQKQGAINSIAAIAVGGVALSVPFYWKNLARLGTKISSGGKDDGYNRYKD